MNAITRSKLSIGAAVALALTMSSAIAQNTEEVKVQATRLVSAKLVGQTASGVPIRDLSLTYGVSLEGLDLSTNSGATEAAQRVSDAAMAACKEIGRQYPDATPSDAVCAKSASDKAMPKLHQLVTAAEKARK